nr:OmpH family outer membrane protein [Orrella daihaiensis]
MAQSGAQTPKKDESAQPFVVKIGFVNTQRILQDSGPSKLAQENIEKEFKKRNDDLQKEIAEFRKKVQQFEKDAPVLAESDRNRRQRELGNLDADLQRKQREIQEDFNRRRNEEFAIIIERANAAIMQIADKEQYDLILQDAVTVSDRVDITDKVIKALESKN